MNISFTDIDGCAFSEKDIAYALRAIAADECETLFVHSDISFGRISGTVKRQDVLHSLYDILCETGVKNLIFPTFTFSFCNHEDFDVKSSRSYMGALSEYVRKLEERYRTDDPLLSVSVPIDLRDRFYHLSDHSLGKGSALDVLHGMEDVKFLFFGAELSECFTYVHYVEKMMNVPYRYDQPFEGNIIYSDGTIARRVQYIHTQCEGVKIPFKYDYFEDQLLRNGLLKKIRIADRYISCISEIEAYNTIKSNIESDGYYFVSEPFRKETLIRRYTYRDHGRITHC